TVEPSLPRALGSQPFSGPDIDYYFEKYFEHYHSYMPVVRQRDPNKCYESGNVLFWTIMLIACRCYAKNELVLPFLLENVRQLLFSAVTTIPLSMSSINALILASVWSFPDTRIANDPTAIFSGAIMNASLLLGIHTGKGHNPEFCFGIFQNNFTDEEAGYTWAGYNITAQRVSTSMGLPPVGCLFNQAVQNVIDGNTSFQVPSNFRVMLECQKFSNRLSKTMTVCMDETRGVSLHIVEQLEEEFDAIRRLICSERSDCLDRFNALMVQLEIQTYYLLPLPGHHAEGLKRNILRAYTTAQTVIRASLDLEQQLRFLKHLPQFYFRNILNATCIISKVVRSSYRDFVAIKDADQSITDAIAVFRGCMIVETDLPARLANILESVWSARQTKWHEEPVSAFSHRLGANVSFDCIRRWKNETDEARPKSQPPPAEGSDTAISLPGADPLANIDWSFMDDFDWNLDTNPLVPVP
ncbi:uncharacterized protein BCR38DRAFT_333745, partial [Pseudomassariella vexata]